MNEYDDDPLVRALRATGTSDELAGEGAALRAYRATFGSPRRSRRALGRLGLGGSALVLSIALGGGVAAAYTRTLPDPVQDFAHSVLGPVGVPPATASQQRPPGDVAAPAGPDTASAPTAPPTETTSETAAPAQPGATTPPTSPPTGDTSPRPGEATTSAAPGGGSSPVPPPEQPSPTTPPTTLPTAPPTAPPTTPPTAPPTAPPTTDPDPQPPTDPTPRPTDLSIAVSATLVDPGAVITVSGTVTDSEGASVAGRAVRLAYRPAGGEWVVVATQRSSSTGSVSFASPPVTENVRTRLAVGRRVISDLVRIEVEPSIAVTASTRGDTIDVSAVGGQAGDTVVLVKVTASGTMQVGRQALSSNGATSFVIEQARQRTVYVVRLLRTPRHLSAYGRITVQKATPDQRGSTNTPTPP